MYLYIKALHIIFVVTWFAGLFYITRLFIYNTEAEEKPEPDKTILHAQYIKMIRRLWLGIAWPSAILTLLFGSWLFLLYGSFPLWLAAKLVWVVGLYAYHFSLHRIYNQQVNGFFRYSSYNLRLWNELATVFLVVIVFLVVLKEALNMVKGILGAALITLILVFATRIYRMIREKRGE